MKKKMLKILLFFAGETGGHGSHPQGLTSIASYMEAAGLFHFHGVTTQGKEKDQRKPSDDNPLWISIRAFQPDVAFMTVSVGNAHHTALWAEAIKQKFPNIRIVLGGFLATFAAEELLRRHSFVDFACVFEGEEPALKLGKAILEGETDFSEIPNLVWRKNGRIVKNSALVRFDMSKHEKFRFDYFSRMRFSNCFIRRRGSIFRHGGVGRIRLAREILGHCLRTRAKRDENKTKEYFRWQYRESFKKGFDLMVSRGCPVSCNSKICGGYWGGRISVMSAACLHDILSELDASHPKCKMINFYDYVSIPEVRELLLEVLPRFPKYSIIACSHLDGLNEEAIRDLASIHVRYIRFYSTPLVETAAARRCKAVRTDNAADVISLLRRYNIEFTFPVHIGTSDETVEELSETFSILDELDLREDELELTMGTYVQPGSIDYERFLEKHPDANWFGETDLRDGYCYVRWSEEQDFLPVMDCSARYDYSAFSRLKNLPLAAFWSYGSNQFDMAPFDIAACAPFINYAHISPEIRNAGINPVVCKRYVDHVLAARSDCGGKSGCRERIRAFAARLDEYLAQRGGSMIMVTGSFYLERTADKIDWGALTTLKEMIFVDVDGFDKPLECDCVLLHLNPESLSRLPQDWISTRAATGKMIQSSLPLLSGECTPEQIRQMDMEDLLTMTRHDASPGILREQ